MAADLVGFSHHDIAFLAAVMYRAGSLNGSLKRFQPLVTAAVGAFDGSLTTLRPFETGPDGEPNPTYRCLFPEAPQEFIDPPVSPSGSVTEAVVPSRAIGAPRRVIRPPPCSSSAVTYQPPRIMLSRSRVSIRRRVVTRCTAPSSNVGL